MRLIIAGLLLLAFGKFLDMVLGIIEMIDEMEDDRHGEDDKEENI